VLHKDVIGQFMKECIEGLRALSLHEEVAELEELRNQLDECCEVAVVGQVKGGKSTLINALLGEDLAETGTTETTATINYFRYGTPEDPNRPVCCHRCNGTTTFETRQFLASLQGNDMETLRRADGIEKLEFFLPSAFLKQVTLVDTPGTGAVIGEHQNRTVEYMRLASELRERHDKQTREKGRTADAVIYVIGHTPSAEDRDFLEAFQETRTGTSGPYNSIGAISKIDLDPEALRKRHELAEKAARQLKNEVSAVVPVSAGLRRVLDTMCADGRAGLKRLLDTLRQIPPDRLKFLLFRDKLFCEIESQDCPVPAVTRKELLGSMQWMVFVTVVQTAIQANFNVDFVVEKLEELTGFKPLRELLDRQFLRRGSLLRQYRIVQRIKQLLENIRYIKVRQIRSREEAQADKLKRYLRLVQASASADADTARELAEDLRKWMPVGEERRVKELCQALDTECSRMLHELDEVSADYDMLKVIDHKAQEFSDEERAELQPLFGLNGLEDEKRVLPEKLTRAYLAERQMAWKRVVEMTAKGTARSLVAQRAWTQYGNLLGRYLETNAGSLPNE
jgi:DNA-directed RNA polymerase subunit F